MDIGRVNSTSSFHPPPGKPVISLCESVSPPLTSPPFKTAFSPSCIYPSCTSLQRGSVAAGHRNANWSTLCAYYDCVCLLPYHSIWVSVLHECIHVLMRAHLLPEGRSWSYRPMFNVEDTNLRKFESVCVFFFYHSALTESVFVCVFSFSSGTWRAMWASLISPIRCIGSRSKEGLSLR